MLMRAQQLNPRNFTAPHRLVPLAVAAQVLVAGCEGCERPKPYTPYTLDEPDGAPSAEPPRAEAPAPAPDAFAPVQAIPPPGDGTAWPLPPHGNVPAPAGRRFSLGLVLDADGDGTPDLVGWASTSDELRGELWFASGKNPASGVTIAALPGDLAPPGCAAAPSLAQVGPHAAAFDYGVRCGASGPRATRWIAVIRFAGGAERQAPARPALALEWRAGLPHDGESIAIAVDGSDRDGDGHDDVTATVTLSGTAQPFAESRPSVAAPIIFLDRPAGLSRDPEEPSARLSAIARGLLTSAQSKTKAAAVAPAARQLRRFFATVCSEGGAPEVSTGTGPIRCGGTAFIEDAGYAEALAAFTMNNPAQAIAALAETEQPFKNPARQKEIAKLFAKSAPAVTLASIRKVAAAPSGAGARGGLGPLAFEPNDDLLVRTAEGVARIDAVTFAQSDAGLPTWPERFAAPDNTAGDSAPSPSSYAIAAIEQSCDEPVLSALMQGAPAPDGEPRRIRIPLPIAARTPCVPIAAVPWVPLGASGSELVVAVGTEVVSIDHGPTPRASTKPLPLGGAGMLRGAARSPDGAAVALPFDAGVLVVSGTKAQRWIDPALQGASGCVPSNGGKRLACVKGGEAMILLAR
jgi:hypothetical protein